MSNKIIKSISFNVTNAEDLIMLKAIKKRNFSGYVKKLIMADLNIRKGLIFDEVKDEINEKTKNEEIKKPVNRIEELQKRSQLNQQNKKSVNQPQAPKVFRPNN
jgi:exopolyphosphatase/pppGpp-phosphohydrolase